VDGDEGGIRFMGVSLFLSLKRRRGIYWFFITKGGGPLFLGGEEYIGSSLRLGGSPSFSLGGSPSF
jgi:hypothetical protein